MRHRVSEPQPLPAAVVAETYYGFLQSRSTLLVGWGTRGLSLEATLAAAGLRLPGRYPGPRPFATSPGVFGSACRVRGESVPLGTGKETTATQAGLERVTVGRPRLRTQHCVTVRMKLMFHCLWVDPD